MGSYHLGRHGSWRTVPLVAALVLLAASQAAAFCVAPGCLQTIFRTVRPLPDAVLCRSSLSFCTHRSSDVTFLCRHQRYVRSACKSAPPPGGGVGSGVPGVLASGEDRPGGGNGAVVAAVGRLNSGGLATRPEPHVAACCIAQR